MKLHISITPRSEKTFLYFGFEKVSGQGHRSGLNQNVFYDTAGERCTAVPLQVQDSDKTKLEVHGGVSAQLRVENSYNIRQ